MVTISKNCRPPSTPFIGSPQEASHDRHRRHSVTSERQRQVALGEDWERRESRPSFLATNRCRRVELSLVRTRRQHSNRAREAGYAKYLKSAVVSRYGLSTFSVHSDRSVAASRRVSSPLATVACEKARWWPFIRVTHARRIMLDEPLWRPGGTTMQRSGKWDVIEAMRRRTPQSSLSLSLSLSLFIFCLPTGERKTTEDTVHTVPTILAAAKFCRQYGATDRYVANRPNLPI